ncbi:hypothetical protein CEXT_607421 [Caerostris extrusa]|uniref:Uncharacterized protein n=1 Tax=Caerostris extrusa TaxID=172846 RepID=A0AAV4Y4M6_CAEEX|nr:hypothetical protein CEXT_607421 [Caerostris extrusa]
MANYIAHLLPSQMLLLKLHLKTSHYPPSFPCPRQLDILADEFIMPTLVSLPYPYKYKNFLLDFTFRFSNLTCLTQKSKTYSYEAHTVLKKCSSKKR